MVPLSATFLYLAAAAMVSGAIVSQKWSLTAENISPDGFTRSAELVNGVFPGPLLTANKYDTITVNVSNNLLDPTMRRSTSIVRKVTFFFPRCGFKYITYSTGTGLYASPLYITLTRADT